jgi:hypothetical protein
MPKTSEARLKINQKWRDNNKELYNEIVRNSHQKHYYENLDSERKRCRDKYYFQTECKRLISILI